MIQEIRAGERFPEMDLMSASPNAKVHGILTMNPWKKFNAITVFNCVNRHQRAGRSPIL